MGEEQVPVPSEPTYTRSPFWRAVVSAIPWVWGAIDSSAAAKIDRLFAARMRSFFEEIEARQCLLGQEHLDNSDLMHAIMVTVEASQRTRSEDKRRWMADLLANHWGKDPGGPKWDLYEEYLSVLEDLSPREARALAMLRDLEDAHPLGEVESDNELRRAWRFWEEFQNRCCDELGIAADQLAGFLARLNRTGLYRTFTGMYLDYEGDVGGTTGYFDAFIAALGLPAKEA